jgi:hypothetical protein
LQSFEGEERKAVCGGRDDEVREVPLQEVDEVHSQEEVDVIGVAQATLKKPLLWIRPAGATMAGDVIASRQEEEQRGCGKDCELVTAGAQDSRKHQVIRATTPTTRSSGSRGL